MALVDYSDSDSDNEPKTKKQKIISGDTNALPPLPAGFRDLYSSTVRTSTQDDPALHAGRKRVTPHIAGNWPTHVYLDWTPNSNEHRSVAAIVEAVRKTSNAGDSIHSLLQDDLGVQLPLHVSLSRPLALKTEQKDVFLVDLKAAIKTANVKAFKLRPMDLIWHFNEDQTRWFLVLRLQRPAEDEMRRLLNLCNDLAGHFAQPLLYQTSAQPEELSHSHGAMPAERDGFHISIAWSLQAQGKGVSPHAIDSSLVNKTAMQVIKAINIDFGEVKVRIGQDVTSIHLPRPRLTHSKTNDIKDPNWTKDSRGEDLS